MSVITMISSENTIFILVHRSVQMFMDSQLSSGLSSCLCAQDFV